MDSTPSASDMPPLVDLQPIISLDELLQTIEAVQSKENADRVALTSFFEMNEVSLKDALKLWASQGFPENYIVFELQLNKLEKCIDGETRDIIQYIQYLRPNDNIVNSLNTLQSRLPGMGVSYSYTEDFKFRIHVRRL